MILSSEFPSSPIQCPYLYHYQITYLVIIDDHSTTWQPPPVWISRVKHFWREAGARGAKLTIFRPLVHRSALVMWLAPLCISLPRGCRPGATGCPMASPDGLLKTTFLKTRPEWFLNRPFKRVYFLTSFSLKKVTERSQAWSWARACGWIWPPYLGKDGVLVNTFHFSAKFGY